jgi:hypothetical protein
MMKFLKHVLFKNGRQSTFQILLKKILTREKKSSLTMPLDTHSKGNFLEIFI